MVELATKADLLAMQKELQTEPRQMTQELQAELRHMKQELQNNIETLCFRLTVRLGAIAVVGLGAVAIIVRLT